MVRLFLQNQAGDLGASKKQDSWTIYIVSVGHVWKYKWGDCAEEIPEESSKRNEFTVSVLSHIQIAPQCFSVKIKFKIVQYGRTYPKLNIL